MDLNKYENPITNIGNIKELQQILVQTCIDYIRKNNLTDVYEVNFSVDGLEEGFEYGEWTPGIDSSISVVGLQSDGTIWTDRKGEKHEFRVRRLIGDYM